MEETPALGPVYAECVDLSVMISKYPHDPNVGNFRGAPDCGKQDAAELEDIIKDMELAGFKLGNVLAVMGDRNGSRSGMFACFDAVGFASFALCHGKPLAQRTVDCQSCG